MSILAALGIKSVLGVASGAALLFNPALAVVALVAAAALADSTAPAKASTFTSSQSKRVTRKLPGAKRSRAKPRK